MNRRPPRDETVRLLLSLTGGFTLVCAAVIGVCTLGDVRWHIMTSSYQVFLIGMFCGGLLTTTLVLGTYQGALLTRGGVIVFFIGILVTGTVQVFFFHLLGGARYVHHLVELFEAVWS